MGVKFIKRRAYENYAARIGEITGVKLKVYRLWKATPARHSGRLTS
jgi:hypothetical protein